MNTISKYLLCPVVLALVIMGAGSCKKSNYLNDGGLANAKTSLTTYDYLKGNAYQYFDSTIQLIDHFGLKDSVNKAGTFFAFTDFAINIYMTKHGFTSMSQLFDSVSSKFLTQYMFGDTSLTLSNAGAKAVQHANWAADTSALSAIWKIKKSYSVYLAANSATFDYYILQYIKINGVLDGSPNAPANDPTDTYLSCQTTGIHTASGTTLHILANNASLNPL